MTGKAIPKIFTLMTAALSAAALILAGAATASADDSPPAGDVIQYVNLGDSYSAGFGSGQIIAGPFPGCLQTDGVSHVSAIASLPGVVLTANAACAGMTSAQVSLAAGAASGPLATADLVTLSLGGNDLSWPETMMACSTAGSAQGCDAMINSAKSALASVQAQVHATLSQLDQQTEAKILVLGYPRLLSPSAGDQALITAANARRLNAVADELNRAIRAATASTSAKFIPVLGPFNNNGLGSSDPWLYFNPSDPGDSFNLHPTATGYLQGYFKAIRPHLPLD